MLTKNIITFYIIIAFFIALFVFLDSYYELNNILIIIMYFLLIVILRKKPFNIPFNINYKKILISLLFVICLYVINDILVRVFILEYRYFNTNQIITNNLSLLFILKAIIVFPFVEEFLFRKIFLNHLLKKYNYIFAILISAIGFSIAHITSENALHYTFILGIFLGYTYYKFKNVIFCIILHAFNNALNILLPSITLILFENEFKMVIVILSILIFVVLFLAFNKIRKMQ